MPLSDNVDPARRHRSDNGKAEKTDTTAGMGSARTGRRGIRECLRDSICQHGHTNEFVFAAQDLE